MIEKKDAFEDGYFWEYYKDLELQFQNYLQYVPYLEGNENTHSFRLANLLLGICSHIDSVFKEIAIFPEFHSKYPNLLNPVDEHGDKRFPEILDFLPIEEEYSLSERRAVLKTIPERITIFPFKGYNTTKKLVPKWWSNHNKIKHNFTKETFKLANLQIVRDALAGAFILNVVHKPVIQRLNKYGLLKPRYGSNPVHPQIIEAWVNHSKPCATIETEIFFYDYEDNPAYKSKIKCEGE
ncbi:MAG: hypothetical protein NWF02_07325 [Candidatus Bathyarchaeota archaeon]|nr:hypothetical protein [Candidatus Bathyarchaeum sp.]